MTTSDRRDDQVGGDQVGGDQACWLEQVCPECGAFVPGDLPASCWRCDTLVSPT